MGEWVGLYQPELQREGPQVPKATNRLVLFILLLKPPTLGMQRSCLPL